MAVCIDNSANQNSCYPFSSHSQCQMNYFQFKLIKFCKPSTSNLISCIPNNHLSDPKITDPSKANPQVENRDYLWLKICDEAKLDIQQEPILSNYYHSLILTHSSLEKALANHLSIKLSHSNLTCGTLYNIFSSVFNEDCAIKRAIRDDLEAVTERDPACISHVHCFLNFKGFLACQAHRVAHKLWSQGRKVSANVIQNRISEIFAVDIHPGAKIGSGILLDHATGVVIGETAVIGNNVTILHNVTLGSSGKVTGDRHPKIGDGVLIGAGTKVLGNIRIGDAAKIGAGSVVLKDVPPNSTAVGNPARLLGQKDGPKL